MLRLKKKNPEITPSTRKQVSRLILSPSTPLLRGLVKNKRVPASAINEINFAREMATMGELPEKKMGNLERTKQILVNQLSTKNKVIRAITFKEGGKRKTLRRHTHKRHSRKRKYTRKQTIPPVVVEALELAVEAGGAIEKF